MNQEYYDPTAPRRGVGLAESRYWPARRVSWGAIFSGVIVALTAQLLLMLLGLAIGLSILDAGDGAGGGTAWSWGTGIWWLLTMLISLFLGGWVAGQLAGAGRKIDGSLHGLVAGSLTLLVGLLLVGTLLGASMTGVVNAIQQRTGGGTAQIEEAAEELGLIDKQEAWQSVERDIDQLYSEQAPAGAAMTEQQLSQTIRSHLDQNNLDQATQVLSQNLNLSEEEARRHVVAWNAQYSTGVTAEPEQVSTAMTTGVWWAFLVELLALAAALLGGLVASKREERPVVTSGPGPVVA